MNSTKCKDASEEDPKFAQYKRECDQKVARIQELCDQRCKEIQDKCVQKLEKMMEKCEQRVNKLKSTHLRERDTYHDDYTHAELIKECKKKGLECGEEMSIDQLRKLIHQSRSLLIPDFPFNAN
jgi:hypothetical protein